jgi:pimeloyl-ACP methyl ester carboxylesterase
MRTPYWILIVTVAALGCAKEEPEAMRAPAEDSSDPTADAGPMPEEAALPDTGPDPEADVALTTIGVGDLVFQARSAGPESGEPVILLHGFPQTSRAWRAQIADLAQAGYRVIAPDQRGYSPGARPAEVSGYRMIALYQDVLAIADALHVDRFHLVGHDWGGSVGWVIAAFAPQRLLSFTAISSPHLDGFARLRMDPSSCQAAASSYMAEFIASDAETKLLDADAAGLRRIYAALSASDREAYVSLFSDRALLGAGLNWYRANLAPDSMRAAIGPVRIPTLQIWSDGDIAICRDTAELTREFMAGPYRFEVIEGAAHWVPELASARVSQLLREHFAEHPAR